MVETHDEKKSIYNGIENNKGKSSRVSDEKKSIWDGDSYYVSYGDLKKMLEADDIEEVKDIIIGVVNNTDFDTKNSVLLPEALINAFLISNDIEVMKSSISKLCNYLDESKEQKKLIFTCKTDDIYAIKLKAGQKLYLE